VAAERLRVRQEEVAGVAQVAQMDLSVGVVTALAGVAAPKALAEACWALGRGQAAAEEAVVEAAAKTDQ
jgi:hypothetical protein